MLDEDLLQFIWSHKCYGVPLHTTEGEPIQIVSPGRWNAEAGPDFLDAKLIIGDAEWAGHVEVHIKTSLWFAHGHDGDPNYNPTVLHVVWEHNDDRLNIPTLQLQDFVSPTQLNRYSRLRKSNTKLACQDFTFSFPGIKWQAFRDTLLAERLQGRSQRLEEELQANTYDWAELLYTRVARALGQNKNGEAMQELARRVPMHTIARLKNNLMHVEALLFGVSGLLPPESNELYVQQLQTEAAHLMLKHGISPMSVTHWKMGGLRPSNFPTLRIAQFAALLYQSQHLFAKLLETEALSSAVSLLETSASSFWDDRYTFINKSDKKVPKKLGKSAIYGLVINTLVPIYWAYGYAHQDFALQERMLDWLSQVPPEHNSKTKCMQNVQLPNNNAMDSQALIELYDAYCMPRHCLRCLIGREIMVRE